MKYTKPVVIAQNKKRGSFVAGCPANKNSILWASTCKNCERTQ